MTGNLIRKLLRDIRVPLIVVVLLLIAFECLWSKVTERISGGILPPLLQLGISIKDIRLVVFQGPGKIIQTLMGGESIHLERAQDMLTIGFVHPLTQIILCIWAVGRAAGAIAGEIDRGTMELLLAQPVPRSRLLLAHLGVDLIVIPLLCLALWAGLGLGTWLAGFNQYHNPGIHVDPAAFGGAAAIGSPPPVNRGTDMHVDPLAFGPALPNVAALLFAVSGYTMWLSARGRFRGRVLGLAVLITLVQFLVNVIGQLWDVMGPLRPLTVFYYYQPQAIILDGRWTVGLQVWNGGAPWASINGIAVLLAVGAAGYGLALWTFCKRDLPAPL